MNEEFKNTEFRVVDVISPTRLVLNCGRNKGVTFDDQFSVYAFGKMQVDPETKEELEPLYLPRGAGKVVVLQQKICTIESTARESTLSSIYSGGGAAVIAFDSPRIGDLAKVRT